MATIRDVAHTAEVSTATVSHVVNNTRRVSPDTRLRVERAIVELGFRPNVAGRNLALRRTASDEAVRGPSETVVTSPKLGEAPDSQTRRLGSAQSDTTTAILRLLRAAQPISRADIARRLGIHRSTVTDIVRPLMAEGVLCEAAAADAPAGNARMGRPGTGLEFKDDGYVIGLSLGVRQSRAGAVTLNGRLLAVTDFDTPRDPEEALLLMRSAVSDLRARAGSKRLHSIGVSVPGPTCAARRRLAFAPHLGWRDLDVAGALRFAPERTYGSRAARCADDVPVLVENDARAAALYETRARAAEEDSRVWRDFILVRAGTSLGVGLVRRGEVYRGTGSADGWAGEFGHMTIVADGRRCICGGRGCWESYVSTNSAVSLYTGDRAALRDGAPNFAGIVSRAEAGEARARATLARVGDYLGVGVANLIGGLGISRVVITGRLALGWKFMNGMLHEAIGRSMAGRVTKWSVVAGRKEGTDLSGALEVAIDYYLSVVKEI